jgi:hypothetical protein
MSIAAREPRHVRDRHALGREAAAALFFLALAVVATRPLVALFDSHVLGHLDVLVDLWTVHWLTRHFFDPAQVFQGNIFYPARHAVLHSDLSLGTVVLLLPLRPFVRDPVPLTNLAALAALAFGGWAFHALGHAVTGNRWAGLLCGVLAAFNSHQMRHLYHLNLLSIGWLALFLLGLYRTVERPTVPRALLTAAGFALSAQSSGYYGVAALVLGAVFVALRFRALASKRVLAGLGAAALAGTLLTLPYLVAYLDTRRDEGLRRNINMSAAMAFHPTEDLTSDAYAYRWFAPREGERLFPGLLALVLAAIAVSRRRPGALFFGAALVVMLLLSLGPRLELDGHAVPLPYAWLYAVPPFDGMRHPYSFAAVATFLLAVLAALGYASLGWAARPWAGPLVVLLAVAETLSPPPFLQAVPPGVPPAYEMIRARPPAPILEVPVFAPEALVWAARHALPVVNGQGSAFVPGGTRIVARLVENHWVRRVPADLDASKPALYLADVFPALYVIVPAVREPGFRPLAAAFDRSRLFAFVAEAPDGDRIYELRRDRVRPPARIGPPPVEEEEPEGEPPPAR